MASSLGPVQGGKISFVYSARCDFVGNGNLNSSLKAAAAAPIAAVAPGTPSSSSSSASVVFKVQYILRLSVVGGNPLTEYLEEKDWQPLRESSSSLELPWSADEGLVIIDDDDDDDDDNLQISEALTLLRVPKFHHQWIIDILRKGPAAISPLPGLAPKMVVHIFEVTQITLPLTNEEGKAIYPEYIDDEMYDHVNYPPRTEVEEGGGGEGGGGGGEGEEEEEEKEEEIALAKFSDSIKKYIVGVGDINEEDEDALIDDWFLTLTEAINRVAWQLCKEEVEEAKEAKQAKEEEEAKVEKEGAEEKEQVQNEGSKEQEEEFTCPICMEIIFVPDGTWMFLPCCAQVFHRDCISTWTKRLKKCPWCRSSLPLVLQSGKGLIRRLYSGDLYCPECPGVHDLFVVLWHVLSETVWWINRAVHDVGCKCGCQTANMGMIRA